MGYNTKFQGVLKVKNELSATQDLRLDELLEADVREYPEWHLRPGYEDLTYIDFELTYDLDKIPGIKWNHSEKSYHMVEKVNLITDVMRQTWPEFAFEGELLAQGDEIGDIWKLKVDSTGKAYREDVDLKTSGIVRCPNCNLEFTVHQND